MTAKRFPRWVYREGQEPDPRFSLANERTFLAWIRTALALAAAGVALVAVNVPIAGGLKHAAAVVLVVFAVVAAVQAWLGWARTERAIRRGEPLPGPSAGMPLVVAVVVAMVLILIGLAV